MNTNQIKQMIVRIAKEEGLDPNLALAVAKQESGFNPKARSGAGAAGLFQLMPFHWRKMGIANDPYNPEMNAKAGIRLLKSFIKANNGDVSLGLAAYNAGQGSVNKYNGIPPYKETQNYVKNIMSNYKGKPASSIKVTGANSTTTTKQGGGQMVDYPQTTYSYNPTGYSNSELLTTAVSDTDLIKKYDMAYRLGILSKEDYANILGVSPDNIPNTSGLTDTEKEILNREYGIKTEDLQNVLSQGQNALLQAQQQSNAGVNMYDLLNQRYQEYANIINQDPRLSNKYGYYLDPQKLALSQGLENASNLMAQFTGLPAIQLPTYEDIAKRQYQARIANEMGVPYEDYMAAITNKIKFDSAVKQQEINNMIEAMKQYGLSDREIATQLSALSQKGLDALTKSAEINADYGKTVGGDYITAVGDTKRSMIENEAQLDRLRRENAVKALQSQIEANRAIDVQNLQNVANKYNTDVTAGVTMRGQDTNYNIAGMQQPAKNLTSVGNFYANTSPVFGYTPQQQSGMVNLLPNAGRNLFIDPNATPQQVQNVLFGQSQEGQIQNNPNAPKAFNMFNPQQNIFSKLFGSITGGNN
jgi:hypothetical protein